MNDCGCTQVHQRTRIVLTGGPGAGKTAVLELIRQACCSHVKVLPEAAGIVFGGGFPRRTPSASSGYNHHNPLRTESAALAAEIDVHLAQIWAPHPKRFVVASSPDFFTKAAAAIEILRGEMPDCCRRHVQELARAQA